MNTSAFPWLDITIGIVLLLYAFGGYREGFIKSVLRLVVVIAAFIGAKILNPAFCALLKEKTSLYKKILDSVTEKIAPYINSPGSLNDGKSLIGQIITKLSEGVTSGSAALAEKIATAVFGLFAFLLLFLLIWLVLKLISKLIEKASELPVVRTFDKLGGVLLGVIKGLIVLVILLNAAYYLNMLLGFEALTAAFDASVLMKYFYLTNIISLAGIKTGAIN